MPLPGRGVLSIESSDPGHVIAVYNPLVLVCFRRQASLEELQIVRALAAQGLAEGIRGGLFYVIARQDMARGIDPRARTVFEELIRESSDKLGMSAVVVVTAGFGGALFRGFLSGLVALTRKRGTLRIFRTVSEAYPWLAEHHGLDAAELASAYERATAHLTR